MTLPTPETAPVRSGHRTMLRVLSVAVGALLTANGVILAENSTGTDFEDLFRDGVEDARGALSRLLDPDHGARDESATRGGDSTTTTSTTTATAATVTPSTDGAGEATTTTSPGTTPGSGTTRTPGKPGPGKKPGTPAKGTTPTSAATVVPGTPAVPGAPTTPVTGAAAGAGPDRTLASLRSFVEQQRGMTFKSVPPVVHLDGDAFKSRLASYRLGARVDAARKAEGSFKTLGIVDAAVDLVAQINRLLTGTAPAFYDAGANELVLRGDVEAPFTRKILVHELTHALNDQHFELHRPALRDSGDEAAQAFEAMYEGLASEMEDRYVKSLPQDDQDAIAAEQKRLAGQFPKDLPPYVLINFGFPYTAGKRFAANLLAAGGNPRVNEAMARPPVTTEQILRPEKYGAGEAAMAIAPPGADGAVVSQGVLGQLTLALMLAEVVDGATAEAAADGWGGDRYVAWRNGDKTCVRLAVVMDGPEHSSELQQALSEWVAARPGAVVDGTGPFTVTRCA